MIHKKERGGLHVRLLGCRKSPADFFDSLHTASLYCLLRSPKSCRCAVQTPAACVCRHSIQHEGSPAPSYSPCETERFFSKQRFFDKLRGGLHVRLFLTALSKHAFHHLPHLPLRQTVGGPEGEGKAVFGPQGHPDAAVISPPLDRRVPDG